MVIPCFDDFKTSDSLYDLLNDGQLLRRWAKPEVGERRLGAATFPDANSPRVGEIDLHATVVVLLLRIISGSRGTADS